MDSQEDPRNLTVVQGDGELDSEYQTELSSPNHGLLRRGDSVLHLHRESPPPLFKRELYCLTEEDEDVDYPPPRLITGLPEPISVDDQADNSILNYPEESSLKAPCLLFTTDEIKNYIDHLETKLNSLHQRMQEVTESYLAEQTDNNNRLKNQQDILDQQEDELIFYRKFYKTGKNYLNEPIYVEYEGPKTPPEAEFRKYTFGRKLPIEKDPKDVDPDIKKAVDDRIQEILEKTQILQNKDMVSTSPISPRRGNSFKNILYINHEFDDEMNLEYDDFLTPTKTTTPIYEVPLQFRDTNTSVQDQDESIDRDRKVVAPSDLRNAINDLLESDIYEVPVQFQDERTIGEHATPILEIQYEDQLLQQSKSSQDPYRSINISECGPGMKYDIADSPSPNPVVHVSRELEYQQHLKVENNESNSTKQLEINKQNSESHLSDLLEIAKNLSTSQDEPSLLNDVPMTQEEQRLIEEIEKYVGIYNANLESATSFHTESPMFGKIPYIDIGSVPSTLRTSKLTDLIVPSMEKQFRKSTRKVGNEIKQRPVKSANKRSAHQSILPPLDSKKINKPSVPDFKTRKPLPDISKAKLNTSATKTLLHRETDTTLLHLSTSVAPKNQLKRHDALPQIRDGCSRKPYNQDVGGLSLPKIHIGNRKSSIQTSYERKENGIVLPKIKSAAPQTGSKQNLRQRIKSSILPDMMKPENMSSISTTKTSKQAKLSTVTFKQPRVLLPVQPNLYQSNRRKERQPCKLPPICNLGLDDILAARKD